MIPATFLVFALSLAASVLAGWRFPRAWLALLLLGQAAALAAAAIVLSTGVEWEWRSLACVGGEPLHLRLDAIGALFLALLAILGGAGAVYGMEYWRSSAHPRSAGPGRACWSALVLCLGLVLVMANGLHFLFAWELFTVSAYFLVTLDRRSASVRAAGWLYLGASHLAALCLFAYFALLASSTGTWDLVTLRERADLAPLFWLALVGFGLKAGVFPLHVWLPSAHASAPTHVSAMLSGMTLKVGIYGLVRFSSLLPVPPSAGWVVAGLGVVSAVLGVAFALGQHDFKRLLAYHSVENIGIILIGLGFALMAVRQGDAAWGALALAGGLLHVWNHGLFKGLLFLAAGSVLHATGTREMSRLGGLWRAMPWTTSLFALGAIAISGLPPLNGFVSEWLIFLGLFDAGIARGPLAWGAFPAAILLGVTGALALACFVKVGGVVFLGASRSPAADGAHEGGWAMRGPMVALAVACVAIGLAPAMLWPALARVVVAWQPGWEGHVIAPPLRALGTAHALLAVLACAGFLATWRLAHRRGLTRAPTWDCGYVRPTARMQYTAGSLAATIVEWFNWVLRPVRHESQPSEILPVHATFAQHVPETVLERLVNPVAARILSFAVAARRLQHGRVQAYLLYLLLGVAGLAVVVLLARAA